MNSLFSLLRSSVFDAAHCNNYIIMEEILIMMLNVYTPYCNDCRNHVFTTQRERSELQLWIVA